MVIEVFVALANAIIIIRRLLAEGWTRYRWDGRPARQPFIRGFPLIDGLQLAVDGSGSDLFYP